MTQLKPPSLEATQPMSVNTSCRRFAGCASMAVVDATHSHVERVSDRINGATAILEFDKR